MYLSSSTSSQLTLTNSTRSAPLLGFPFPFMCALAPGRLHLAPQCAGGKPCLAQRTLGGPHSGSSAPQEGPPPAYTEGIGPLNTLTLASPLRPHPSSSLPPHGDPLLQVAWSPPQPSLSPAMAGLRPAPILMSAAAPKPPSPPAGNGPRPLR